MQEFMTAAKEVTEGDERDEMIPFILDGVQCYADPEPPDGPLAVLMATTTRHSATEEQVAGTINFLAAVVDDDTHKLLVAKLLDRNDKFGIAEIQEILEWLIGEWSGRPTQSRSGSTPSRKNSGQKSTRRTRELTSSGSPATDS